MARKRLISPEIWESLSFGELTLLGKVIFIGMISQADDEGKGVLSSQFLKSRILPYDELRKAEVDKALEEIGHKTSVLYYSVDGKDYYLFTKWNKWQALNRPTPSKLPNPQCGEGESLPFQQQFTEDSLKTHGVLNEDSRPIERKGKEKKGMEGNNASAYATRFSTPTYETVREYCMERKNSVDVQRFVDYYTANGWKVGKNPMKDWQAAVRNWEKDDNAKGKEKSIADRDNYMKHDYSDEDLQSVLTPTDTGDWDNE